MILAPERMAAAVARPPMAEWASPNRRSSLVFAAKAVVYRTQRLVADLVSGPRRHGKGDRAGLDEIRGDCHTPLWSDGRPEEHANISSARSRICAARRRRWTAFSCRPGRSSASGSRSAGPAAGAGLSPAACCSKAAWCRRPAAGFASCRTRSTRRPYRRGARSSSGTHIRAASPAPPPRWGATRRSRGTMSIYAFARVRHCGSRQG